MEINEVFSPAVCKAAQVCYLFNFLFLPCLPPSLTNPHTHDTAQSLSGVITEDDVLLENSCFTICDGGGGGGEGEKKKERKRNIENSV